MKKIVFVTLLFVLLLALAACSTSTNTAASTESASSLSVEGQLLIGTLNLESTSLAITTEQASQLLPLWQTLQSLSASGTAADAEVEAVVDQVKGIMSAEQLASISTMDLGTQDLATAVQEYNSANGAAVSSVGTSSSAALPSGNASGAPAGGNSSGGNPGGGNPPSDMGGSAMAVSLDSSSGSVSAGSTGQSSTSASSSASNQVPSALLNAVVELLKKKVS